MERKKVLVIGAENGCHLLGVLANNIVALEAQKCTICTNEKEFEPEPIPRFTNFAREESRLAAAMTAIASVDYAMPYGIVNSKKEHRQQKQQNRYRAARHNFRRC